MRYRLLSVCLACATQPVAYAQHTQKIIKRMLNVRINAEHVFNN
jgi:hypothetical protein